VGLTASIGLTPMIAAAAIGSGKRVLRLRRADEPVIEAAFTLDGSSIYRHGYYELCKAFRDPHVDVQTGYVQIDPRLIDALWELQRRADGATITILSGFRTPRTNEMVGGAARSFHPRAMACDFAVDGLAPVQVGRILEQFPAELVGGIGVYNDDGHVHADTGPRLGRVWCNHDEHACVP